MRGFDLARCMRCNLIVRERYFGEVTPSDRSI